MRVFWLAVAAMIAGGCTTHHDVRPQCHAALTHYYASGCTIDGSDESSAEDYCTEYGDAAPDECQSELDTLFACLKNTPVPASPAQCNCDDAWETALSLCD
jgi:hypothetical protein